MPAMRGAIAAVAVAVGCILHFCPDAAAAPPKKPKAVVSGKKNSVPKKTEKAEKVEKTEPATTPAAAETPTPAPDPLPPPSNADTPPKKDESSPVGDHEA